jgi:hypothetical protein
MSQFTVQQRDSLQTFSEAHPAIYSELDVTNYFYIHETDLI